MRTRRRKGFRKALTGHGGQGHPRRLELPIAILLVIMTFYREQIPISPGHSFRLLRWHDNLHDVDEVFSRTRSVKVGGEGTHWHYHQALELTLIETGSGTRYIGDRIQEYYSGDLVLLGENLPHFWHTRGSSKGISVQWHFPLAHPFWAFPESVYVGKFFKAASRGIHYVGKTAKILSNYLHQLTETEGLDRLGLLFRILSVVVGAPDSDHSYISENSFSLSAETRHQTAMQAAIRYVLINFRQEIRLQRILEETGMSKPTFSRQFRLHCGKTLGEFVQQVRLDAVCYELKETDHPIIDVALGNGFSQLSFFNRLFLRTKKCNPSEYRARFRK